MIGGGDSDCSYFPSVVSLLEQINPSPGSWFAVPQGHINYPVLCRHNLAHGDLDHVFHPQNIPPV